MSSANPPKGTAFGSCHYLASSPAAEPTEWWWSGTAWRSSPGGWGTKVAGMNSLGWRYVGPGPAERSEQAIAAVKAEERDRAEYSRLKVKYETADAVAAARAEGIAEGREDGALVAQFMEPATYSTPWSHSEAIAAKIRALPPSADGERG